MTCTHRLSLAFTTPLMHCARAGIRLLQKMGWRPGRGVGTTVPGASAVGHEGGEAEAAAAAEEAAQQEAKRRRWGTVAGVSLDNTPIYVLEPKVILDVVMRVCLWTVHAPCSTTLRV